MKATRFLTALVPTALTVLAMAVAAPASQTAPPVADPQTPPQPTSPGPPGPAQPLPPPQPPSPTSSTPLEKLRYNPRERTLQGLSDLEQGDAAGAVESFETAGRLAPSDPVARFNAGTVELMAGAEGSLENLQFAAESAPPDLAPAAHFNLGNAHLAAADAAGAIDAYKKSLKLVPGNRDVKHNLEVAQRLLQQQQQEQQQEQQEQQQQEQQQEQRQPESSDDQTEEGEPQEDPENDEGQEPDPNEQEQEPRPDDEKKQPENQKLPDFEEQPDMTAEQAAAILEAVENLERDERRRQAAERARKSSKKGKDW